MKKFFNLDFLVKKKEQVLGVYGKEVYFINIKMVFIIVEIYMSIIMLISLIILSLKKENYKSLMNMMLLFYIISFFIIDESILILNKNKI